MDPPDWFRNQATKLKETVLKINNISPEVSNEYRSHTALKLFCVGYWSGVFTPIMKKRKIPCVYIDLFAGSGLTKVKNVNKFLPGSVIVADTYGMGFDHIICCDSNKDYASTLRKRLSGIREKNSFDVFCCKNEDAIDKIIDIVNSKKAKVFCFYDPEGFEGFSWDVLEKLGNELQGDILITWFESGLWRNYNPKNFDLFSRVFGDNSWKNSNSQTELTQKFIRKLESIRENIKPIEIVDENRTVYHELLCVKETFSGSPFLQAWDDIKSYLETEGARLTETWLKIAYGEQRQLFDPEFY
jgi:three-Cys-motif partner protein